jgi:hypothetical protein
MKKHERSMGRPRDPEQMEILPYVLRRCRRATDAGASGDPGHTVGQARGTSVKPTFCVGPAPVQYIS